MKLSEKMDTHKSHQLFINIIGYFFLANQLHTSNSLLASFIFFGHCGFESLYFISS